MKLITTVLFTGSLLLMTACGGSEDEKEKEEWTVCKCTEKMDALNEKMINSGEVDMESKEVRDMMKNCDKIQDEMGADKFRSEMENCRN